MESHGREVKNPRREDGAFGKRKSAAGERRRPGREGAAGGAEVFLEGDRASPVRLFAARRGLVVSRRGQNGALQGGTRNLINKFYIF